jgi:stalled ribosome rescue protein Dom34
MPLFHAVVWLDHQQARIHQFDQEKVETEKLKVHSHHTKQHGSAVRSEHEFFAEVCAALEGIKEILVVGSSTAQADFRHYVEKHRAALAPQVIGYEAVDHPSDKQLVAMARQYFLKYDRMAGTPSPM